MKRTLKSLLKSERGGIIVLAAAALPMVMFAALSTLDYVQAMRAKSELQLAADSAAIAAANEFYLVGANKGRIRAVAQSVARASIESGTLHGLSVKTEFVDDDDGIRVEITQDLEEAMLASFGFINDDVTASATARPVGGGSLCVIGLMWEAHVVHLRHNSKIRAPLCLVHSNSVRNKGIVTENNAKIEANLICSSGGVRGLPSSFEPKPLLDCPRMADPIAERPEPRGSSCLGKRLHIREHNDGYPFDRRGREVTVLDGTETESDMERLVQLSGGGYNIIIPNGFPVTLYPGTYCKGLTISGNVDVTFAPGVYYFSGDLLIEEGARVTGEYVGIFMAGPTHRIHIEQDTSIRLGAPKDGPMAGMLMWVSDDGGVRSKHVIASNNAPELLGTIYIPQGQLEIASNGVIAHESAYTAIVAEKLFLRDNATLVLNTNYEATPVPVPKGLGPMNGSISLVE